MREQLKDLDLSLNQLIELIVSEAIYKYGDWNTYLINRISILNINEMGLIENIISKHQELYDHVQSNLDLPQSLWANMIIKNNHVSFDIIDAPYAFISVIIPSDLDGIMANLEIEQKVQIYRQKNSFSKYSPMQIDNSESIIKSDVNKTLAACIIAFSLQFPSSLSAISHIDNLDESINSLHSIIKANYEVMQNSKNKKLIPLMKTMYKINELSTKDYFQEDQSVAVHEKEQMVEQVTDMINSFYPNPKKNAQKIAKKLLQVSKCKDIDYRILLSIIKEESDFNQSAYNPSGDYSVAQINYKIWSDEFSRLKRKPINLKKLKIDSDYSIELMGDILSLIKQGSPRDPLWYAKYHSKTPKRKLMYAQKIHKNLKMLNNFEKQDFQNSIIEFNIELSRLDLNEFEKSGIDEQKIVSLKQELSNILNNSISAKFAYNDDLDIEN